jgi:hypothetical protein
VVADLKVGQYIGRERPASEGGPYGRAMEGRGLEVDYCENEKPTACAVGFCFWNRTEEALRAGLPAGCRRYRLV